LLIEAEMSDKPPVSKKSLTEIEKAKVLGEIAKIWPRRMIRIAMASKGATYATLAEALKNYGVTDDEHVLRNKVARGTFSAAFFMQCFAAMEIEHIDIRAFVEAIDKVQEDEGLDEEERTRKPRGKAHA
jgi:hypothetical protein